MKPLRWIIRHRFIIAALLFCAANHLFDGGPFDMVMTVKGQAAGFTTVTGTITDPNGLKYSCGTITAQLITAGGAAPTLNGGGFTTSTSPIALGCPTTPGTGASGSFLMRLADSGVIVPSNTTWRFTINLAPGIAPPAGTGPQSFSVTTAINCATNTPATCTSNAMDISTLLSASAPAISNSAGGGITPVSSLPALPCTANAVVNLTTGAQGIYICINGVWQIDTGGGGGVIFPTTYGVTAAGSEDCSATFVNTSGTVTLSASAVTPTASMVGWSMQGSVGCADGTDTNVMPRCTITSVNSGARTLTGTGCAANANATGAANQHVVFGPIEDTQLTASEAPLSANTGPCPTVQYPSGFIYLTTGHYNSFTCNTQYTGAASTGLHVQGYGRVSSRFMMSTDFNFASGCPLYSGFNTCFFGKNGITKQNFSITGGQNTGTNPAAQTCVINDGTDSFSFNFGLYGFGHSLSNLVGHCMTAVGTTNWLVIEDGIGSIGELFSGNSGAAGHCYECFFGNNSTNALKGTGGQFYTTNGGGFNTTSATTGIVLMNGPQWNSESDSIVNPATGSNMISCNSPSICSISHMGDFGTITGNIGNLTGSGHIIVRDSVLSSGTTNFMWNLTASGALGDDMGGNTFTVTAGQVVSLTAGSSVRRIVPTSTYSNAPGPGLTSCASSASPAVCAGWLEGSVVVAAAATTVTVNTTQVQADSEFILTRDDSLGTKLGVTCNTATAAGDIKVSTRTAGTSFVITVQNAPAVNPLCLNFSIR